MIPDADTCYRAVQGRDSRFDGMFYTAVRTTGIYCRPSCSARTPHRRNVHFYSSAAAAQRAGLPGLQAVPAGRHARLAGLERPRRPGRPSAPADRRRRRRPGRRAWPGPAAGLLRTPAHRALVAEMGAGPIALARAQRAQTARILLETTDLPTADVAFAAGFASVRQFNDTIREVFASTPTGLRAARRSDPGRVRIQGWCSCGCPTGGRWTWPRRSTTWPRGRSRASRTCDGRYLSAHAAVAARRRPGRDSSRWRQLRPCRLRLAAPARPGRRGGPVAPAARPRRRPRGGGRGARRPTRSSPPWSGSAPACARRAPWTDSRLAVRAVVGPAECRSPGRDGCSPGWSSGPAGVAFPDEPDRLFPSAAELAAVEPSELPMPKARAGTLRVLAEALAAGALALDPGADRAAARAALRAVPGLGSLDDRLRAHAGARRS